MFHEATLSVENYDALLRGWSALSLQRDVPFSGGNSKYCAESARTILVDTYNWGITDGNKDLDANCARYQASFAFASPRLTRSFGDAAFTFTATGGTGAGGITYRSTDFGVATIDADSGEVTITGGGTTTITAIKAGTTPYSPATARYTLTIAKAEQVAFDFASTMVDKTFGDATFVHPAPAGSGTGAITYESTDSTIATVASPGGEVTITGVGTTTITATKAARCRL